MNKGNELNKEKQKIQLGFRDLILISVFLIYVVFSATIFFIYNNYFSKNMKEKFMSDNLYASKVVKDLIEEEKLKMSTEARIIGAGDNVFQAMQNNAFVTSKWDKQDGKFIVETAEMSKFNYMLLANQERNKIFGKGRGTEEKAIGIYDNNGNFLGASDYFDKDFIDKERESYLIDVVKNLRLGGVELTFIQKRNNKFCIKALVPIGKNARFFYDDNPKGVIEIIRVIDGAFLDRLERIVNKKVVIISGEELIISTIFAEKNRIENVPVKLSNIKTKEPFYNMLKFEQVDYGLTFIPIEDYEQKVIAYIGVGESLRPIEMMQRDTINRFVKYQIVSVILLLIVMYVILYLLFRPLTQLLSRIRYIREGNYQKQVEIKSTGEIKLLGDSINKLAKEVEKREHALKEWNLTLEEKVKERTEELEKNINNLKTITNITNIIHISDNIEKVIEDVMNAISTINKFNRIGYLIYDFEKAAFLGYKIKERDEEIKELNNLIIYTYNNKMFKKIVDEKRFIEISEEKTGDKGFDAAFMGRKFVFPIVYEQFVFGAIVIETDNEIDFENYVFNILKQSLSIYLNNDHLAKEQLKTNKLNAIVQLLKSIVHEIKTPLVGIKGFSNITKNKLVKLRANEDIDSIKHEFTRISEYMDTILKESDRIDGMAKDLLEYASRTDYTEKYEKINLSEFIENIHVEFLNILTYESVAFYSKIPKNLFVSVHKTQMKKVFTNLIKNSIEAKKGDGKDSIMVYTTEEDKMIRITMRDSGVGIPQSKLKEIFEPLITTKIQGTGLGLTIVKDILEKHGGKIMVDSKENEFTEFSIYIPKV